MTSCNVDLPGPYTDFTMAFSETFDCVKRILVSHKVCTVAELDSFVRSHGDTQVDNVASQMADIIECFWEDLIEELGKVPAQLECEEDRGSAPAALGQAADANTDRQLSSTNPQHQLSLETLTTDCSN